MKKWIRALKNQTIRQELSRQLRALSIFTPPSDRNEEIEWLARRLEEKIDEVPASPNDSDDAK